MEVASGRGSVTLIGPVESRHIRPKGVGISVHVGPPPPSCGHHPTPTTSSARPPSSNPVKSRLRAVAAPVSCPLGQTVGAWRASWGRGPVSGRLWLISTGSAHLHVHLFGGVRERCGLRRRRERKRGVLRQEYREENKAQLKPRILSSRLCVDCPASWLRIKGPSRGGEGGKEVSLSRTPLCTPGWALWSFECPPGNPQGGFCSSPSTEEKTESPTPVRKWLIEGCTSTPRLSRAP